MTRPARSATLRQKDKGVEPDAAAHRHHDLESASAAGSINGLHRGARSKNEAAKKEPVIAPALGL